MELTQLPHMQLINKAGIKLKDFSQDIKNEIDSIKDAHRGWSIHKKQEGLQKLISRSKILAQNIYDYFVEHGDQTSNVNTPDGVAAAAQDIKDQVNGSPTSPNVTDATTTDSTLVQTSNPTTQAQNPPTTQPSGDKKLTKDQKDELILHEFYKIGKTSSISEKELSAAGFSTGLWGRLTVSGCTVGRYRLVRDGDKRWVFNLVFLG